MSTAATRPEADAIHRLADRYKTTCNADDLDSFMTLLTDDVVFMPPDQNSVVGKPAVRAWLTESFFGPFRMNLRFSFDELDIVGDLACGRGPFELSMAPKAGGE
ncbi:MAG: nuclear transport factor 2 family protein, partial [Acidobacteria bacterium]|nr:nuclear transport factor 2 family protein [Acidobacteriota bacterium]